MSSGYELLFAAFDLVERIGWPIAVAAWLTVFAGSIGMALVLRRHALRPHIVPALVLGIVTMTAHASDLFVTLQVTPDLALEGNPIWLIVVDTWGVPFAMVYGFTGKALVGVLNVQMNLWYRVTRARLYPAAAPSFAAFVRSFGRDAPRVYGVAWLRIASLFAYLFGYLGLWSFWVAFQNWAGGAHGDLYEALPSPPVVVVCGLLAFAAAYYVETWAAFRAARGATQ